MSIRTIIVDDEFLARKRLEHLLKEHQDIQIIGQAQNAEEAIALIPTKNPDLLFLDVQMPDGSGFDVLSALPANSYSYIIFATAHDTYALQAFDAAAIDYLLKPFDEDRLTEALDRVRSHIQLNRQSLVGDKIKQLIASLNEPTTPHFIIKEDGYETAVPMHDIMYIEAAGNYVMLRLENQKYLYRSTMNAVEERVKGLGFLRIHRSFFVNEIFIQSCTYSGNNEYTFTLKESTNLISSRSYKDEVVAYLKNQGS